jgi:uncharacterized repeat protein (TIGR01451 family)/CSLREA domain-containing protein
MARRRLRLGGVGRRASLASLCFLIVGLTGAQSAPLAVYTVTNTNDSGAGSLRQAILDANASAGSDQIAFAIPGSAPFTIQPASPLPNVTQAVEIDGTTQAGFSGTPIVELDGSAAGASADGLTVQGSGTTIRGLVVNRFGRYGINLSGSSGTVIRGNYIGTDVAGTADLGNGQNGIIANVATNAVIGGPADADRNVISGNGVIGIYINWNGTIVQNNYIGTDATGTAAIGNQYGVQIIAGASGSSNNEIGGADPDEGNLISGNSGGGILVNSFTAAAATTGNRIEGNRIGLAADGDPLGNGGAGITITSAGGMNGTTIGGTSAGAGNVIAHNAQAGIAISSENVRERILRNSIHSNGGLGIDLGTTGVTANDTGDADTGSNDLQNFPILGSATSTQVSGVLDSTASQTFDVDVYSSPACDSSGNGEGATHVASFQVTTDGSGHASFAGQALAPSAAGVVTATATDSVGNTSEFSPCVTVDGPPPPPGLSWVVNTTDDTNDGSCTTTHCSLREAINRANTEAGTNSIGFDIAGAGPHTIQPGAALPTITEAVVIDGTTEPSFGGTPVVELDGQNAGAGVSGLRVTGGGSTLLGLAINRFAQAGIHLLTGDGNVVAGNFVGTDATGSLDRGNTNVGIHVQSSNNTIGGTSASDRNVASGNNGPQIAIEGPSVGSTVHGNVVVGNHVGTNASGTAAVETIPRLGVVVQDAYENRIGGTAPGESNVISGNNTGVRIANSLSRDNLVQGNRIGTAADGTNALGNNTGVDVMFTTQLNTIGGTGTGEANTIAHNLRDGVLVYPSATRASILGNSIHSNFEQGIDLYASGSSFSGDGVTANDAGDGDAGGNNLQNYPTLTSAASGSGQTTIAGSLDTSAGSYRLEFFSSSACDTAGGNGEGLTFLGSHQLAVSGVTPFSATLSGEATIGHVVTATATGPDGSTSEFSACASVTAAAQPVDVSISKTDSADPVTAGSQLTYTLTVDNAGPGSAANVVVTDTLPSGVDFVSASNGGSHASGVVTWNLGTLAAADPALDLTLVVDVDAGQTAGVSNTASVSTSSADSNTANDSDVETTSVEPPADLTWLVNTTADTDDGLCTTAHCSLREAIDRANTEAGADTIGFDIDGAGTHTIQPTAGLPRITEAVVIDATTQPGFSGSPVIEIDGSAIRCGSFNQRTQCGEAGFVVDVDGPPGSTTIRGFAINGFTTNSVKVCVGSTDCPYPGGHGIVVDGSGAVIEGNRIGTDVTGTQAKPNQGAGIKISGSSNRIGGTAPGQGNVISANGTSPYLEGGIAVGGGGNNVIQGNAIGTGANGSEILGNIGAGVLVASGSETPANAIGGFAAGAANTVVNNTVGVIVFGAGAHAPILGNEISANAELGIDLESNGVTPNDANDADTGGNGLQNFPTLTSATSEGGQTEITGSLSSADGSYRVEFFSNVACDASGHGEGETYLGFQTVAVSSGAAAFSATLPVTVALGAHVTATATDAAGNTSEFSACATVAEPSGPVIPTLDPPLPPQRGAWSWGMGYGGRLGSGAHASRHVPGLVIGADDAEKIAVGTGHALTLSANGQVESWGSNGYGELGAQPTSTPCNPYGSSSSTYTIPCRETAASVGSLSDVDAIAAGNSYSLALGTNGAVYSWGANWYGQLGVAATSTTCTTFFSSPDTTYDASCRPVPTQVSGLSGIVAIAAGDHHSLALDGDGNVYSWGANWYGQLGVAPSTTTCTAGSSTYTFSTSCRAQPQQVPGLSGIVAIAVGRDFSLALDGDGRVYSWGANFTGQLGIDPDDTSCVVSGYENRCRAAPAVIPSLSGVTSISAGSAHAIAVTSADAVYAWGSNWNAQLGVEPSSTSCTVSYGSGSSTYSYTQACRPTPGAVPGLTGIADVAAGWYHNLAVDADGDVFTWGTSWDGALGDTPWSTTCESAYSYGTYTYTYQVSGCRATPRRLAGLTEVDAIDAGYDMSFALGTASPNLGVTSFRTTLPAGGSVTSDVDQDGATADDPVEVVVETPNAGEVSVSMSSNRNWNGDFNIFGRTVDIEAPDASSADDPLVLTFVVDVSLFPETYDVAWLWVYRNGSWVQNCTGAGAAPDPCVASRTRLADGNVELVVRTTHASAWTIGIAGPTAEAGGPYEVDEGSSLELDATDSTGGRPPLSYIWSPTAGLDDIGSATPSLHAVDDGVAQIELTVVDALGLTDSDIAEVTVKNVAPSIQPIQVSPKKIKPNTLVKVTAAFADAGVGDTHSARWTWGDGKSNGADLTESEGAGTASGTHVYSKAGTYTITLTVTDDDGGSRQRTVQIVVTK